MLVGKEGSLLHFLILLHGLEEGPCVDVGLFNAQYPHPLLKWPDWDNAPSFWWEVRKWLREGTLLDRAPKWSKLIL